jgi:hypothetical protein
MVVAAEDIWASDPDRYAALGRQLEGMLVAPGLLAAADFFACSADSVEAFDADLEYVSNGHPWVGPTAIAPAEVIGYLKELGQWHRVGDDPDLRPLPPRPAPTSESAL